MEKWYIRWLRLLTMLFPGRTYIARGPWYFGGFYNIFLQNIDEDQEKVLLSERGLMALCYVVNPALHYVHKKVKIGLEVATFRTKLANFFTQVIHFNWLAKLN